MYGVLSTGMRIRAQYGEVRILEKIGGGAQGDVYKVVYNGQNKALKWYRSDVFLDRAKFIDNLKRNVTNGVPSEEFLWPLDITEETEEGCFGYVMDLRPTNYKQADEVLLKPSLFSSYRRIIDACLNVAHAFRRLHAAGYVYRDINAGNFFIDPSTGKVLICDNDNVGPDGVDSGIRGTPRFMAPEIVVNNVPPTEKSDRHSLSVIIFLLMMMQHPLEGRRADMLDADTQKRLYGTDPLFIFDPTDSSNAPLDDSSNAINLWGTLPSHMKEMFVRAFSRDALLKPNRRPTEIEWIRQLTRLRSEVVTCPSCGANEVFMQDAQPVRCDNASCRQIVRVPLRMELSLMGYALPVADDMRIYRCQTSVVSDALTALQPILWTLAYNEGNREAMCVKNISSAPWRMSVDGQTYDVSPGQATIVRPGAEFELGQERAHIVVNNTPYSSGRN